MPSDFTVIQPVRQRFGGDNPETFQVAMELVAPFVGVSKDLPFSCPMVNPREMAVLQFESLGVTAGQRDGIPRDIIQVNGVDIPGGITPGVSVKVEPDGKRLYYWKAHTLLVPANVLGEQNVLHIESVLLNLGFGQQHDEFIIDNIVIFFKTRVSSRPVIGEFAEIAKI